jgi:glycosyltransferase involved in cell wall biosynthesis
VKILQISKFFPPVLGGIESVAWELAEGSIRMGLSPKVLCSNQSARTVTESTAAGYEVTRTASIGTLLSMSLSPLMPWQLRRLARGCDIVHLHMPDPMAALALKLSGTTSAVIVHWHSDVIRQRVTLKLYEPLQDWVLKRADAIVATSEPYAATSAPLQRWLDKVRIIPIGISDSLHQACAARAQAIQAQYGHRRIVFSLGRMTYYKGFDVLVAAASRLPDDCILLIGGEGELLDTLRAQAESLQLSGKVIFLGHIPDDVLADYFLACDVFCMPSTVRAEAYGVAIVEAMALGKPVVATDIPGSGVPWVNVQGLTGINVPVRDPSALAAGLIRLLNDAQLRAEMGNAARQRYLSDFNAQLMNERMVRLYQQVCSVTRN